MVHGLRHPREFTNNFNVDRLQTIIKFTNDIQSDADYRHVVQELLDFFTFIMTQKAEAIVNNATLTLQKKDLIYTSYKNAFFGAINDLFIHSDVRLIEHGKYGEHDFFQIRVSWGPI
jgi:hypothetical protein